MGKFKYLGTLANQNCMHEESKCKLNLGNACYPVFYNLVFALAI